MVLRDKGAKLKEKGLCTAAAAGDLETIKVMVMNGVDINIGNYIGRTMLHLACSNKRMNVIDYLLQLPGIDPNVVDWYEGTPCEDAMRGGHMPVCAALKEVGGVVKGDSQLDAEVAKIKEKRVMEKEKFFKKREAQKAKDKVREGMLDELTMLCKIAMEDIVDARRLLDALNMSLAARTWKKKEAIDKAPKPDLEEVVTHFLHSFQRFMIRKHALKLLKLYQFCVEFVMFGSSDNDHWGVQGAGEDERLLDEMVRVGQLEYDRYLDPLSPDFVAINPKHSQAAKAAVFDGLDLPTAERFDQIRSSFTSVSDSVANILTSKYLTPYHSSPEFHAVATSSAGRTFRVLKMCRRARGILTRLEKDVAVPMQQIVSAKRLNNDMYTGASQFNATMSTVSIDFQQRLLDAVERVEVSALGVRALHEKQARKKKVMRDASTPTGSAGGKGGGLGVGGAFFNRPSADEEAQHRRPSSREEAGQSPRAARGR